MKKILSYVVFLLLLISCHNHERKHTVSTRGKKLFSDSIANENEFVADWLSYYKALDTSFSFTKFKLIKKDTLHKIKGTILGSFDPKFDTIYTPFLRYDKSRTKYIDFDSYNWTLDENNIITEIDQEIDLVNLEDKSVQRIAFRGALQWVEEAYWKNNSTVVLLENTIENKPVITEIDLVMNQVYVYEYHSSLQFKSEYFKNRLTKVGFSF
ncbi:MAG: hypothetical protein CMP76_10455 [Flavobacterium sp.]|uniref:hypothetical protein n=1 Tax=Flavobacterium sp. TaxID=239 RepID=UPI000C5CE682|nr:hypothetical protein [Flavobacterium sp.]MBF03706.1 hypothetical protein [Flavobacterium sp.]|tara:strand:- start:846 stop:1478 length:633 start_codon:yes stop_codon:yes gene_type:complete